MADTAKSRKGPISIHGTPMRTNAKLCLYVYANVLMHDLQGLLVSSNEVRGLVEREGADAALDIEVEAVGVGETQPSDSLPQGPFQRGQTLRGYVPKS